MDNITIGFIVVIIIIIVFLTSLFKLKKQEQVKEKDEPVISLVYFLESPREMTAETLRQCATRVFSTTFDIDNPEAKEFVMETPRTDEEQKENYKGQMFIMDIDQGRFLIHNSSELYVKEPKKVSAYFVDDRLKRAFNAQKAWLSVDSMDEITKPEDKKRIYQAIGKLMAELAGPDVQVIYSPELHIIDIFDKLQLETLRSENPLSLFEENTFPPVLMVSDQDIAMQKAVNEAQERFPEFIEVFKNNKDKDRRFCVKAWFEDDNGPEFMWISVTKIKDQTIYGTLDNEPLNVKYVKRNQRVKVPFSKVRDWFYQEGEEEVGGFTIKVLAEIQKRRQESHRQNCPYSDKEKR